MTPRISAVITTFNRAAIVPDAIAGVLAQTLPAHELIVVDDGSSDTTEQSVRHAFARANIRCRYVRKANGGMATALNRGVEESTGDWVAFLDDDDLWCTDHLERYAAIVAQHPGLECLSGLRELGGRLETPPRNLLSEYETLAEDGPLLIKRRAPLMRPFFTPVVGTAMIHRRLFREVQFEPEAGARLDIHFFWRLSQLTGIALDARAHGIGRQYRTSYLSTDDQAPQALKDEIALKRNRDELRMLRLLLRDTILPEGHQFDRLRRQTLIGQPYLLRGMGRHREALRSLRGCIGEVPWTRVLREALLCLAQVRPRTR